MKKSMLHVFRNSPYGRETLLQSAYTCQRLQLTLDIYIPVDPHFRFYLVQDVVQFDLDDSYLQDPETARKHVEELLKDSPELWYRFVEPTSLTAPGSPNLASKCSIMVCPRAMAQSTSRIGLGHIGPKVRRIIQTAPFPVLMSSGVHKPWNRLTALFGGSKLSAQALKLADQLSQTSQAPLSVISFGEKDELQEQAAKNGVAELLDACDWQIIPGAPTAEKLYAVPHDALVVLGGYGHGMIKTLFGSTMELVQSELSNRLLVIGPKYQGWD